MQGAIQVQGSGPSLWNPVPEDPFGGILIGTDEACTLYTVQHHGQVKGSPGMILTVTVKDRGYF